MNNDHTWHVAEHTVCRTTGSPHNEETHLLQQHLLQLERRVLALGEQVELHVQLVRVAAVGLAVVLDGEAVVQQEAVLALFPVAIVDRVPGRDRAARVDGEVLLVLVKAPARLPGPVVVEHVGHRHHPRRARPVDLAAKIPAAHNHPRPREPLQREARERRVDGEDLLVVAGDGPLAVLALHQEVAALEVRVVLFVPEDGHPAEVVRQNVVVRPKERVLVLAVDEEEQHEVDVLGRVEAALDVGGDDALARRGRLAHLDGEDALVRDRHDELVVLDRLAGVHAAVALGVLFQVHLGERAAVARDPVDEDVELVPLRGLHVEELFPVHVGHVGGGDGLAPGGGAEVGLGLGGRPRGDGGHGGVRRRGGGVVGGGGEGGHVDGEAPPVFWGHAERKTTLCVVLM